MKNETTAKTTKSKTAAKKAAKKAAPKAAKKAGAADGDALAIHINTTGRLCFSKNAAARLGKMLSIAATVEGKLVQLAAKPKQTDGAWPVRRSHGRPYISATTLLKPLGFDGSKPYDVIAKPLGTHGFEFKLS